MMNDTTGKKKTVMVVEDYKFTQDLIISLLEGQGYIVIAKANNGKKALDLYQELSPDIVTMDMNMPGMNGLQTIQALLNIDPEARILAITGYKNIEDKALETGAKGFLVKPFQPKQLYEAVEKILNSSDGSIESEMAQPNSFTEFIQPVIDPVIETEQDAQETVVETAPISSVWGDYIPQDVPEKIVEDSIASYEEPTRHNDSNGEVVILSDDDEEDDLLNPSFDFPRKQQNISTVIEKLIEVDEKPVYEIPDEPGPELAMNIEGYGATDPFEGLFIRNEEPVEIETVVNNEDTDEELTEYNFETAVEADVNQETADEDAYVEPEVELWSSPSDDSVVEPLETETGTEEEDESMSLKWEDDYTNVDDEELIFILNKPLSNHPQPQSEWTDAPSKEVVRVNEVVQPVRTIGPNNPVRSRNVNEPLVIKPPKSAIQMPKPAEAGTSQGTGAEPKQIKPKKEKKFSFFNIFKKNKKGKEDK